MTWSWRRVYKSVGKREVRVPSVCSVVMREVFFWRKRFPMSQEYKAKRTISNMAAEAPTVSPNSNIPSSPCNAAWILQTVSRTSRRAFKSDTFFCPFIYPQKEYCMIRMNMYTDTKYTHPIGTRQTL